MAFSQHHEDLVKDELMLKKSHHLGKACGRQILTNSRACQRMLDNDITGLDHSVKEIKFVEGEMELKMEEITSEIEELISLQISIVNAQDSARENAIVTMFCLEERKKRDVSERVQDDVETELMKEKDVVEGVLVLLKNMDEQTTEQIRLNRSAKSSLEQDLQWKLEAENIDQFCSVMTPDSIPASMLQINTPPSVFVTPQQWERSSEMLLGDVSFQTTNSQSLRALLNSVLKQTMADMQKRVQVTTAALELNVEDMKFTKRQMMDEIPEIVSELSELERKREDMQTAVTENEKQLSLTKCRLTLRSQRPETENRHDYVHSNLLTEVQRLNAHIKRFHDTIVQVKNQQSALRIRQIQLMEFIDLKNNSIYIDEVICLQKRKSLLIL